LLHRVAELNAFIAYVLSKPALFNSPVVDSFFDSMLPESKVGDIIKKYGSLNYRLLAQRMEELYPQYMNGKCTPQHKVAIEKFREKIRVNVDFYQKLKAVAKENRKKLGKEGIRPEYRNFHSLLMMTMADKKELHGELSLRFKSMCENNETEMWYDFEKKVAMLIEETSCFLEIAEDLRIIEELYVKNRKDQDTVKVKTKDLERSNDMMVGFFKRKLKTEKMDDYRMRIIMSKSLDDCYSILLDILPQVIINSEMDIIKQRKKVRYDDAIRTFSARKMKTLEDGSEFWDAMKTEFDTIAFSSEMRNLEL